MHKITVTNFTKSGLALIRNEQLGPSLNVEDPYSPTISVTDTEIPVERNKLVKTLDKHKKLIQHLTHIQVNIHTSSLHLNIHTASNTY